MLTEVSLLVSLDFVGAIDETQGPHAGITVSTTTLLIFPSLFCNNEQAPNMRALVFPLLSRPVAFVAWSL